MPWHSLGQFQLIDEWSFSQPVIGEIFRISHRLIDNVSNKYLKAVIAQGFDDGKINIFNPQRLSYRLESEIFTFYFPSGIARQKIAFKRLDQTNIDWVIEAEVFLSDSTQENFANYIISRFGELMPLFDTAAKTSFSIEKENIEATVSTQPIQTGVAQLVQVNGKRRGLSIYNPSFATVTIGCSITEVDGETTLEGVLAIISPGKIYELPVSGDGSCYSGQILGKADNEDVENSLQITQFEAV